MNKKNIYLMCPPEFFDVAYIINPWMKGNIRAIDNALAKKQWRDLYDIVCDHATVRIVLPQPGSPDMVFTANAGLVLGKKFITSRFRYPERQYEEPYFADWFMDRGFDVKLMPREMYFEGAGDALFDRAAGKQNARLWMAHGHRSLEVAAGEISAYLKCKVETLQLVDDRFYHLDTCFCPLEGGYVLYYPQAFDAASQAKIAKLVPDKKRIAILEEDALAFACNAVNIGKNVIVNKASADFVSRLSAAGYNVIQTPLTEFMKAGGSAKCLTLRLNETLA
jgi:N-dimethylarginine dimethylaminohydrolase